MKEEKTADCVVVGLRWKKGDRKKIATLLLGLYRDDGGIDYVGTCAVAARAHDDIAGRVLPLLEDAPEQRFSEPNRWGTGELEEAAVRPELVVEVRYDKVQGTASATARSSCAGGPTRTRRTARGASCALRAIRRHRASSRCSREDALEPELLEAPGERRTPPPHPFHRVADLRRPGRASSRA